MCISLDYIYITKMIHGPYNVKFRQLFAELSVRISFDPGLVCTECVVEQLTVGQIFRPEYFGLPLSTSSHQCFVLSHSLVTSSMILLTASLNKTVHKKNQVHYFLFHFFSLSSLYSFIVCFLPLCSTPPSPRSSFNHFPSSLIFWIRPPCISPFQNKNIHGHRFSLVCCYS